MEERNKRIDELGKRVDALEGQVLQKEYYSGVISINATKNEEEMRDVIDSIIEEIRRAGDV